MLRLENVHKRFGDLHVLRGVDLELKRGEVVCVIGPERLGQVDPAALHQPARTPGGGPHLPRGHARSPTASRDAPRTSTSSAAGSGSCSSSSTCSRTSRALANVGLAQTKVLGRSYEEARAKARVAAHPRRPRRQAQRVPRPALGRPAAAGGDRPGAGDGPARDAVRRGHQRARPGAGQGGPRRDARARRRGHDDDRRHPRDGLRPRGREPGGVHGRGAWSSRRARPPRCSDNPQQERTKRFLGLVLEH